MAHHRRFFKLDLNDLGSLLFWCLVIYLMYRASPGEVLRYTTQAKDTLSSIIFRN